jgi:HEAT repeat protein
VNLVRSCAAESLGALAYEPAITALGRLLISDRDELVRASAAEALAAFDGSQMLAFAQQGLDDSDPTVRAYAIQVIARSGDRKLLPLLDKRLAIEKAFQPQAALLGARYLLGSDADLPHLLALLDGTDLEQSTIVLNVLRDVISQGSASSIIRDAALMREALVRIKERNSLLGRHASKVLQELAKRLGATRN